MSATPATIVRPEFTKSASAFPQLFSACCYGIVRYFARRAAIASLRELDDRALGDIGLVRSQIEAAVDGFIALRPSDDVMLISYAATVSCGDGRPHASAMEPVTWS